jgi:hypothetical protein
VLVPIIVIWPGWVVAVRGHPRDVAVLDGSVQVRSGTFLGAVFLAELAQRARRVPTVGLLSTNAVRGPAKGVHTLTDMSA